MLKAILSQLQTIWTVLQHSFTRSETVEYPEQMPYLAPRYRGRRWHHSALAFPA